MKTVQSLPTRNDIFDVLFNHQESVKNMLGIEAEKAKYGKYIAVYGTEDIKPYPGGKTKKGSTTPTNKNNGFKEDLKGYRQIWKKLGIDPDALTNSEFQSKAYDYILKNDPDTAREMWKEYG